MAWLHAERFPWSGLRCGTPFATGSQGFPETPLDVTMQGLFYQTSTAVFRSSCFFNSLLRCRAPTIIQKTFGEVWRSVSKTCSLHCGASTRHRLVSTMAWYFACVEYARASLVPRQWNFFLVKEMHDSILEFRFLHCKFTCRTLGEEDTLHGSHVQHILRVDARNKHGTRKGKCFAGTRLWAIGRLLREMRPDGTLFCRVSWISALCNYFFDVLWEMLVGCTGFGIFWCTYIFSLFRLRPYIGLACGRWGWLDLTWPNFKTVQLHLFHNTLVPLVQNGVPRLGPINPSWWPDDLT